MGWTYSATWGSASAMRDHLRELLRASGYEIVKDALVAYGHRYYAATRKGGKTNIFVALINGDKRDGGPSFGYKDMDESKGPYDVDCPLSVLDLASPIEELYGPVIEGEEGSALWATNWRAKVRAYHAKRAEARARAKTVSPGDIVWVTGARGNPFTVSSIGMKTGKVLATSPDYDGPVRLPKSRIERVVTAPKVGETVSTDNEWFKLTAGGS